MKKVKYRVSVVQYNPQKTNIKPIPAIGSYSNFSFEPEGIRVWKAYGIGSGNFFLSQCNALQRGYSNAIVVPCVRRLCILVKWDRA